MTIEPLFLKSILLVVFLFLSAFFSASETALFSLDSIKIKRLSQEGKNTSPITKLLENPLRCLTTILAGNTLVNIAIAAIVTSLLIDLWGQKGLSASIGVTTLLLLLFGEVTPKTVAIHNSERLSYLFARPLYFFGRLIRPFLFLSTKICDAIIASLGLQLKKEPTLTEEEFRTIIEVGQRHGVVGKSEKEMVVSILELTKTTAQEVMTPRTDIKAISLSWDQERILEFARTSKHSRYPVFKDFIDNIQGIVYARELFLELQVPLAGLVKPVMFVPATKRIDEIIKDFYKQNTKTAVVIDEYGGTNGLVTMEDILEEVFGEIHDEFEISEKFIEHIDDHTWRISGKMLIEDVSRACGLHIKEGDYETVAGYLLDVFGKIPCEGEHISTPDGEYTIEKVTRRRIKSILLKRRWT